MSSPHLVEYARSSSGLCDSSAPCKGAPIEKGQLRYGRVQQSEYGTSIQWRHWTCVTRQVLGEIAGYGIHRLPKWDTLKPEDQRRITIAIASGNSDPTPTPKGTANLSTGTPAAATVYNKRKIAFDAATPSSSSSPKFNQASNQPGSQEPPEEEVTEELYTTMNTKIVGIQYYQDIYLDD
jgi:SWI/SNF-related matrix-associated actin-dependent regulator of chromatin subfamily A3